MGSSSWDTSVFVPKSPRIVVPIVPERPPWRGRASIRSASKAHPGCLYLASQNFLLDVRRFCCSLPAHSQNMNERLSIRPGQKGSDFPVFRLRFAFLGQLVKSPGRRPSRPDLSIQVALSDSHIADIYPWGWIIKKKGLRGCSSRRNRLSALGFHCPGVPREAMKLPSSLVRMRDRPRVVLPCVRDEGRALHLISSHLGTRSRSGGMAEVLKGVRERGNECAA